MYRCYRYILVGWTQPRYMGWIQPRPARSLAQPSDHGVNYYGHCIYNAVAEGLEEKKKGKLVWQEEERGWRRSWCCREDQRVGGGREGGRKTRQRDGFFSTLTSNFSFLAVWNPPLFIGIERETCCFLWNQIFVFDSNQKDHNR